MILFIFATIIGLIKKQKMPYWKAMLWGVVLQVSSSLTERNVIRGWLDGLDSVPATIGAIIMMMIVVLVGWVVPIRMLVRSYNKDVQPSSSFVNVSKTELFRLPGDALLVVVGLGLMGLSLWITLWLVRNAGLAMLISLGIGIAASIISAVAETFKERSTTKLAEGQQANLADERRSTNSTKKAA